LKESDEPKGSYLLLLQDAERNLRCKAVPGSFCSASVEMSSLGV
jgi:hypothetical protein